MKGFQNIYIPDILNMDRRTFASTEGARTYVPTEVDTPPQGINWFLVIAIGFFGVAGLLLGKGIIDHIYDKYYKGDVLKGLI